MRISTSSFTLITLVAPLLAQSPITPGHLIVSRVGDGTAALTNAATARFLVEYQPNGTLVQAIALPTAPSGGNRALTDSGTATSNGFLTQSVDGRYLLTGGYDAALGTASVTGTASATVNRVIARIGLDASIDTSTALVDAYTTNNFRGVASVDGSSFWISGTGTAPTPGVRYVASLGATTSTQLSATVTNIRCVNIVGNQLYCSASSGTFQGVSTVGTGLPIASGQTTTLLPGFPTATGPSAYDFFFADANTLYVADDRNTALGGIQKWTLSAGTWTLAYTLAPAVNTGCRGLSGCVENGVTTLFATTSAAATQLVSVVDGGAGSTFTVLATAPTNTAFRDVQFVRTPGRTVFSGTACANNNGTPTVGTIGGDPVTGNPNLAIATSNSGPLSFVLFLLSGSAPTPFGLPVPGTPACALVYVLPDVLVGTLTDLAGDAVVPLPVPANCSLGGAIVSAQIAAFDPSLVGFSLPIGTSNALQITIGN
jgi:hypothetical protein